MLIYTKFEQLNGVKGISLVMVNEEDGPNNLLTVGCG